MVVAEEPDLQEVWDELEETHEYDIADWYFQVIQSGLGGQVGVVCPVCNRDIRIQDMNGVPYRTCECADEPDIDYDLIELHGLGRVWP
jgi:hypothetical protein